MTFSSHFALLATNGPSPVNTVPHPTILSVQVGPWDSSALLHAVAETVPLDFALADRAPQPDLSLAHSHHFPIATTRPGLNGDFFSHLKRIWLENRDIMTAHGFFHLYPLPV
jgi:hypothetical protein